MNSIELKKHIEAVEEVKEGLQFTAYACSDDAKADMKKLIESAEAMIRCIAKNVYQPEKVHVLPYDVKINHMTFKAGVDLETFVGEARRWFDKSHQHKLLKKEMNNDKNRT